jgi:hypothetical protein
MSGLVCLLNWEWWGGRDRQLDANALEIPVATLESAAKDNTCAR